MKQSIRWTGGAGLVTALLALALFTAAGAGADIVRENTAWSGAFTTAYGSNPNGCSTCHTVVPTRNPYGMALEAASGATMADKLHSIEGDDSDGDGASNIDEINAGTNPGDPSDTPPPPPSGRTYVGSGTCSICHNGSPDHIYNGWKSTLHSSIYRPVVQSVGMSDEVTILPVWSGVVSVEDTAAGLGPIWVELNNSGDAIHGPFTATIYSDAGLTQMVAGPLTVVRVVGARPIQENGNEFPRNVPGSVRGLRSDNDNPIYPGGPDFYPGESRYLGPQLYQVMIGEQHYTLPIQYNPISDLDRNSGGWVAYNLGDWINGVYDVTLTSSNSEERRCAGCHQTGITEVTYDGAASAMIPGTAVDVAGAYVLVGDLQPGNVPEEDVACEACHGPGSDHVGGGFANPSGERLIILPILLTAQQQVDACGRCHSRGHSVGTVNGMTFDYPYRDAEPHRPIPGDVWSDFFVAGGEFWPSGRAKVHNEQYLEFINSVHFNNPFVQPFTCTKCHDVHGTENNHDIVTEITSGGNVIPVTTSHGVSSEGQGTSLCYACHQSHQFPLNTDTDRERHYWHPPQGTHGSPDCTNCHMPATAVSAVAYDIHSHLFGLTEPEETVMEPQPNSCAILCHRGRAPLMTDTDIADWGQASDSFNAEWLQEHLPGSQLVADYLAGSASAEELLGEHEAFAPAFDHNRDTQTTTGMDASPFVIDAADIVDFVNDGR